MMILRRSSAMVTLPRGSLFAASHSALFVLPPQHSHCYPFVADRCRISMTHRVYSSRDNGFQARDDLPHRVTNAKFPQSVPRHKPCEGKCAPPRRGHGSARDPQQQQHQPSSGTHRHRPPTRGCGSTWGPHPPALAADLAIQQSHALCSPHPRRLHPIRGRVLSTSISIVTGIRCSNIVVEPRGGDIEYTRKRVSTSGGYVG
mmetsp:Transcript_26205/g.54748  ORF Transcript_26205/g.54748 Transcript_26205/m.54748 type:complete len:202 (+) Transcript_26205:84-689(+)